MGAENASRLKNISLENYCIESSLLNCLQDNSRSFKTCSQDLRYGLLFVAVYLRHGMGGIQFGKEDDSISTSSTLEKK